MRDKTGTHACCATDTVNDLIRTSLACLIGKIRIGKECTTRYDKIRLTACDHVFHHPRLIQATDNRNVGLFDRFFHCRSDLNVTGVRRENGGQHTAGGVGRMECCGRNMDDIDLAVK